jgi:hypothetical protein
MVNASRRSHREHCGPSSPYCVHTATRFLAVPELAVGAPRAEHDQLADAVRVGTPVVVGVLVWPRLTASRMVGSDHERRDRFYGAAALRPRGPGVFHLSDPGTSDITTLRSRKPFGSADSTTRRPRQKNPTLDEPGVADCG